MLGIAIGIATPYLQAAANGVSTLFKWGFATAKNWGQSTSQKWGL